jgi:glycine oxidase
MEGEDPAPWEARLSWQRQAGLEVERLTGDEARSLEPGLSPRVSLALHFPREGRVDPRALARALPLAAERAGARFRSTRVLGVAVEGSRVVGVDVEGERIEAPNVVVAAGAWTSLVEGLPLPAGAVEPLRGQMVELGHEDLRVGRIVFSSRGYVVPRGEGRVVAGSTMERVGFDKRVTAEGVLRILDQAIATFPSLAKAEPRALWAGLRPYPKDGLPLIGATEVEGLFVCSGHHRNGILLTPVSAALLSRAVIEGKEPEALAPFSPRRFSA